MYGDPLLPIKKKTNKNKNKNNKKKKKMKIKNRKNEKTIIQKKTPQNYHGL